MNIEIYDSDNGDYHDVDIYVFNPDVQNSTGWKFNVYVAHASGKLGFSEPENALTENDTFENCPESEVPREVWGLVKSKAGEVCRILNTNPLVYHAYYDAKL